MRTVLILFETDTILHYEFLPKRQIMNHWYYLTDCWNIWEQMAEKWSLSFGEILLFLHDDNAPAHPLLVIHDFLVKNNTVVLHEPLCSPDLVPVDCFFFEGDKLIRQHGRPNTIIKKFQNFWTDLVLLCYILTWIMNVLAIEQLCFK